MGDIPGFHWALPSALGPLCWRAVQPRHSVPGTGFDGSLWAFCKTKIPDIQNLCLKLCRYIMYQIVYRYISYNHHVHLPVSIHCISPCVCAPVVHAIRAGGTPWDIPRHTTSCCREVQGHSSGLPTHFLLRIHQINWGINDYPNHLIDQIMF